MPAEFRLPSVSPDVRSKIIQPADFTVLLRSTTTVMVLPYCWGSLQWRYCCCTLLTTRQSYKKSHKYSAFSSNFNYLQSKYSTLSGEVFLTLDIRGINDIRLISSPVHAPSHELDDTDANLPLTRVTSNRTLVELLGIREESVLLYLWGMNPFAYFSLLFYVEACFLHLGVWCTVAFGAWRW
jgi:hypothetical protein